MEKWVPRDDQFAQLTALDLHSSLVFDLSSEEVDLAQILLESLLKLGVSVTQFCWEDHRLNYKGLQVVLDPDLPEDCLIICQI